MFGPLLVRFISKTCMTISGSRKWAGLVVIELGNLEPQIRRYSRYVRPGFAVTGLYSGPGPLPEPPIGVSAFGDDPSRGPAPGAGDRRAAGAMMLRLAGREARGPLSPARAKSGLPILPRRLGGLCRTGTSIRVPRPLARRVPRGRSPSRFGSCPPLSPLLAAKAEVQADLHPAG